MATDNSKLSEKLTIRREVIDLVAKKEINVLELYAGRSVMWRILQSNYAGQVKINLTSIEKERGKNPRALCGDNLKFLAGMDLSKYDIIDVDAYGIPARQIAEIHKKGYEGWVVVTAIQSMMGNIPNDVLIANGLTSQMIKKCRSLFCQEGLEYILNYVHSFGATSVRGYFGERKYYFYYRTDKNMV